MKGFVVFVMFSITLSIGISLGNISSTHEVGIKSLIGTQEACKDDEGLYMIESKRDKITALCKNGNKFELKDIK